MAKLTKPMVVERWGLQSKDGELVLNNHGVPKLYMERHLAEYWLPVYCSAVSGRLARVRMTVEVIDGGAT
jgi:hypothetical protein